MDDLLESAIAYINKQGDAVQLLPNTATNLLGDKLLWVRCANGSDKSIWENEFKALFNATNQLGDL